MKTEKERRKKSHTVTLSIHFDAFDLNKIDNISSL